MIGLELTPEEPLDQLSTLAMEAESVGFDTIFASHHYNNRDEFIALADIARETQSVALGPGVTNPYETHPVTLASRMATLDELSDGRAIFGIGAGDRSTLENLGFDREQPLRRVLETMQVSRRLWNGEQLDHTGTFQATDVALNYEPTEIPVYVGAQGPHMTQMAAKYADGVLYNGSHPLDIEWASDRIKEGITERDPSLGDVDFTAYAPVSIASDAGTARDAARAPVSFIAGGAPTQVLERHDLDTDLAATIRELVASGRFHEAFGNVSAEMIEAFCIAGTPETVESRLVDLLETVDSVVFAAPLGPDLEQAIELMGELRPLSRA